MPAVWTSRFGFVCCPPTIRWIPSADSVLAFARGERFACLVNFGPEPIPLLPGHDVLIASNELEGGALPQDTTVWLCQALQEHTHGGTAHFLGGLDNCGEKAGGCQVGGVVEADDGYVFGHSEA